MNNTGYFVISLDFELLWGVFDLVDYEKEPDYFRNTKKVIPRVLDIFNETDIHATWATVGMLFNENWDQWKSNVPGNIPQYHNNRINAYEFGFKIKSSATEEFCFAPDLIKMIAQTPGQEIGSHTYSHYYCAEEGQEIADFECDLSMAIELAKSFNLDLKSLVFPRNQLNPEYYESCSQAGIVTVRSNPDYWYWQNTEFDSIWKRLARTGDAYFPLGRKDYTWQEASKNSGELVEQRASRFLRPVENNLLRNLKLRRIVKEMEYAAKHNRVYHLWWHPHNFGARPQESLKDLRFLMEQFKKLNEIYGFKSVHMEQLSSLSR